VKDSPREEYRTVTDDEVTDMLETMAAETPREDLEYAYGKPEALIHYVMDLEELVRWFALLYRRDYWSPEEEGCTLDHPHDGDHHHEEIGDPIWTLYDERGTHLAAAEKLQETWNRVMHDA
jgi:hypothetical protein